MYNNPVLNFTKAILFIAPVFFLLGCTDEPVSPNIPSPEESNNYKNLVFSDKIELLNYPTFGSPNTNFNFEVVLKDSSLKFSKIKYDFTYDHKYDITFTAFNTVSTKFKLLGFNTVIASIILEDKTVLSCSTIVWLTKPSVISSDNNFYFEPNIYNGKIISVTHGPGHLIQLIDLNTLQMNCYFCGFPKDPFNEMHCSVPSFDGNKILFSHQMYSVSYYDFVKNDSTITNVPINLPNYPVGQVTWSLDSKSIYYVSLDNNKQVNGIKSYNLESNQIGSLYNSGKYICVIPDQKDKIAILEKVDESKSKLIIYNIMSRSIEKKYNDIPFYTPFRMLRDTDRVYFDGKLAFYSLSRKKVYYMHFDELDLSGHMYGEADINMDGDKFVVTTWGGARALYSILLPNFY